MIRHNRQLSLISGLGLLLTLLSGSVCHAKWARPDLNAPVDRLITNIEAYIKKNPKDAQGYYTLGRLHSLAFAKGVVEVELYSNRTDKTEGLPTFPSYHSLRVERDSKAGELTSQALEHFRQSIHNYRRATQLDTKNGLSFLGLGWMLEQGHLLGTKAGSPPIGRGILPPSWRGQALIAYRTAFRLSEKPELEHGPMRGTNVITKEAAEGIERLYAGRTLSAQEQRELTQMKEVVKKVLAQPRPITPIVFPLDGSTSLRQMLTQRTVTFDLAGDDIKRRWPWVKPSVGILVWDPEKKGRISSGRQLFGSVTWWMFWKDGYEPLAALDNNRDGALTGKELEGIAVWRDANSNGISDPGEVVPARKFGIKRIATQADGQDEGTLRSLTGIQLQNGATLPTFDWAPTGHPLPSR